ncbi:hypothetical protein [Pusillimonas minor]|uniref:Uncharacterized protein n=1 Tax=Pusillimonas minor TaxID=2697024 RepID=A0A842HNV7_9BURK|nr:hypothetical protein [Pusillimonas minor]MBC2768595.1 hypothetical protein [Pusillimonas minor]
MAQQTVLKDEQINQIRRSMQPWQLMNEFARAIEQAVLQSPEVQALRKDAERLDFMISEECQIQSLSAPNGVRHRLGWPDYGETQSEWFTNPRVAIDAAMEKQK